MSTKIIPRSRRSQVALLATLAFAFLCGSARSQPREARRVDQFGQINAEDAMARLDRFAIELKSHPDTRGIIVASNTDRRNVPRGTFLRLANGYLNYLVNSRAVEADRISVAEGERKTNSHFELWTLPRYELSTISEEASAPEPAAPELFDRVEIGPEAQCVGHLPIELYKLEDGLRIFTDALQRHTRAKAWIVVHPRPRDSQVATQRLINRSRQFLLSNHIRADRVLTAVGSPRLSSCTQVRLWIVPGSSAKADEASYYSQLMDEAQRNEYTMRRVEFVGNEHIRDNVLRKQFVQGEGDLFSRKLLDESLKNLSSLGLVYPVTLGDVEPRLDREEKLIDLTVYFRERRKR